MTVKEAERNQEVNDSQMAPTFERHFSTVSRRTGFSNAAATLSLSFNCLFTSISLSVRRLEKKKRGGLTSMFALMRAGPDIYVHFEAVGEASEQTNSYRQA